MRVGWCISSILSFLLFTVFPWIYRWDWKHKVTFCATHLVPAAHSKKQRSNQGSLVIIGPFNFPSVSYMMHFCVCVCVWVLTCLFYCLLRSFVCCELLLHDAQNSTFPIGYNLQQVSALKVGNSCTVLGISNWFILWWWMNKKPSPYKCRLYHSNTAKQAWSISPQPPSASALSWIICNAHHNMYIFFMFQPLTIHLPAAFIRM